MTVCKRRQHSISIYCSIHIGVYGCWETSVNMLSYTFHLTTLRIEDCHDLMTANNQQQGILLVFKEHLKVLLLPEVKKWKYNVFLRKVSWITDSMHRSFYWLTCRVWRNSLQLAAKWRGHRIKVPASGVRVAGSFYISKKSISNDMSPLEKTFETRMSVND